MSEFASRSRVSVHLCLLLAASAFLSAQAIAAAAETPGAPAGPAAAAPDARVASPVAPCTTAELGSPYIPLDSWMYTSLTRLYSLGYLDTAFLGLRPWTRL